MGNDIDNHGFAAPAGRKHCHKRCGVAFAELVTIVGLALSIIVAAAALSVGAAYANVAGNVIDNEGSLFTIALLLGLVIIAMGGLTMFTLPGHRPKKH
jgi:uncharacterized membrane protein